MNLCAFLGAAVLLSVERLCYLWIWREPAAFQAWCRRSALVWIGKPVDVLRFLFCCFKILQCAVFVGWCYFFGNGSLLPLGGYPWSVGAGAALILVGQILNVSVFYQLGKVGVFYGDKFGYEVSWCRAFPFSLFEHPQYVGALLSIWGFFLAMRFPHDDWYILPALQSVYYSLGAYFER